MIRVIFAALLAGFAPTAMAGAIAIINVNVLPMDKERVLVEQTVIVEGGRIVSLGPVDSLPLPEDAEIIDGTDRYLMPGLAEMHAHLPPAASPQLDRHFSLFVANGVTTVRGMLGHPSHLGLRRQLLAGDVFGPRLITAGPSFNGQSVSGTADVVARVRQQADAGYDFLKIHPGLKRAEFEALAETANEIGIPFAGHVTVAVGVEEVMRAGMATIDHLDGYMAAMLPPNFDASGGYGGWFGTLLAGHVDTARIEPLAAATAAAGTWNVPTNVLIEQLIDDTPVAELRNRADMRYMPRSTVAQWVQAKEAVTSERDFSPEIAARAIEIRRRLIIALHDAGAGLLLGSDAPQIFNVPGFSLHYELENMVDAGLSPFDALRMGTANVAEFLELPTGLVARGREADLVLLDANPLEDISNTRRIHGVMLRGEWYSGYELQDRIERYRYGAD
ncbi:MAG: amidohydrolase family protein [Woeseiaceae bacterium]|nr:amidohydrolase family protein [Woeseiaceae bacterium]